VIYREKKYHQGKKNSRREQGPAPPPPERRGFMHEPEPRRGGETLGGKTFLNEGPSRKANRRAVGGDSGKNGGGSKSSGEEWQKKSWGDSP